MASGPVDRPRCHFVETLNFDYSPSSVSPLLSPFRQRGLLMTAQWPLDLCVAIGMPIASISANLQNGLPKPALQQYFCSFLRRNPATASGLSLYKFQFLVILAGTFPAAPRPCGRNLHSWRQLPK